MLTVVYFEFDLLPEAGETGGELTKEYFEVRIESSLALRAKSVPSESSVLRRRLEG
jgi:hypothetical protein